MGGYNWRRSYKRDKLRQRMIATQQQPCHICKRPIDYSLPAGHPWCFEMDEIFPPSKLPPELRKAASCDPNNCAPSHRRCNQLKSNKLFADSKPPKLINSSRDW